MKDFLEKIKFILLFLWQLPQNIVALIMMPFLGKMKLIRYSHYAYAFECLKMRGAISLGNFIFLDRICSDKDEDIWHEYGHVIQSHKLGWLYLLVIGIPSLLNAAFNFTECYFSYKLFCGNPIL